MRTLLSAHAVGLLVLATLSACASESLVQQQARLKGASEQQILACMGAPHSRTTVAENDIWSYRGQRVTGTSFQFENPAGGTWSPGTHNYACQIDLYMEGGRVARVSNTASKSGEAKACLRLISNCTQ